MSLILEALKKAERQHKLGEVPKINPNAEQPAASGPHGMGWLMMALLALILIGIGIYLGSKSWLPPQAPVETEIPLTGAEPADNGQKREPEVSLPREGGEDGESLQANTAPGQNEVVPPKAQEIDPPEVVVSEPPPPSPPAAPPKPLHEMPSGFVANLPAMNIDIHSYDTRPLKRYVLINMEKYREGDYLSEGPRVMEILPQGAVMEHMGERFILPIGNQ
ncbi:MAG: general secretion pathway protein GspB [Candidatus Thiodiazotropha sp.]